MLKLPKDRTFKLSASHVHAPKQEHKTAKELNAAGVRGSGSGHEKGDVRKRKFMRVECKSTIHRSFSITDEIIRKIEDAALGAGEIPFIQVDMLKPDGTVRHRMAVMPYYAMQELIASVTVEEYQPPSGGDIDPPTGTDALTSDTP